MPHTVLLVDDEPKVYQAMRRSLHREPYELLYAESGAKALELLGGRSVDVVIADENMPRMKGTDLLSRVRRQWPDVVRMMLTGDARIETIVGAVNRGEIFRFFVKPANDAELVVSLREAVKLRALKFEASRLLDTVRRQGEQLRAVSSLPDVVAADKASANGSAAAEPPTINLGDIPRRKPHDLPAVPRTPGSVIELDSKDLPDDVDGLLDEIRSQLEKLDM